MTYNQYAHESASTKTFRRWCIAKINVSNNFPFWGKRNVLNDGQFFYNTNYWSITADESENKENNNLLNTSIMLIYIIASKKKSRSYILKQAYELSRNHSMTDFYQICGGSQNWILVR